MDKKLFVFICVIAIFIGTAVFLSRDFNPKNFKYYGNWQEQLSSNPYVKFFKATNIYKSAPEIRLIAGICALLLVGKLFWYFIRKFKNDNRADQIKLDNSLNKISQGTGLTEYELFCQAAEDWTVSSDRVQVDVRRYMAEQVLPYYVKDLVRKNCDHIDKSLIKKEKINPSSWWDLAKALLIFPGSVFVPVFILIIFEIKASFQ
jgi:hypothetical protein